MHAGTQACMHVCMHACMHACMHPGCTRVHRQACTQTCIHAHTHRACHHIAFRQKYLHFRQACIVCISCVHTHDHQHPSTYGPQPTAYSPLPTPHAPQPTPRAKTQGPWPTVHSLRPMVHALQLHKTLHHLQRTSRLDCPRLQSQQQRQYAGWRQQCRLQCGLAALLPANWATCHCRSTRTALQRYSWSSLIRLACQVIHACVHTSPPAILEMYQSFQPNWSQT